MNSNMRSLRIWGKTITSVAFMVVLALVISVTDAEANTIPWQETVKQSKGQTVYFNAWGGSEQINDYIDWTTDQVAKRYGIALKHVKVSDTSGVVSRVLAEKVAGRKRNGTVDLVWINGENFRSMKQNGLLFGPFAEGLPSFQGVDPQEKPTTVIDFGEPVEGFEAPWGMAQLVFIYDTDQFSQGTTPPVNASELLEFARKHKGRVTYPLPPDFVGTTFLKQLLSELTPDPDALLKPVSDADFDTVTSPLWGYLDELHPLLWREGETFPANNLALTPMLDDGEILLSMTFNPAYASSAIASGELSKTVRTYVHDTGTLGNTHFLAIPFNSDSTAAAQVVINFLLSPEAQAHKANPDVWGILLFLA
ncbi:ABC transporter substrate-binding protein [Endozoicomonas sp. SCSIO W0465]|uniref:ABC transporter substrate-binding protein n=1 Tax=Endozoicomonas sp. SCSIO W0465 TaxID=2918516 RepID=UPI002075AAB4|nr:ABC transporter substrate-binding protein [Endozoicomonas sp. SCSIO W0465]USE36026.1 ABC transporter substrate-binding protein [Endozoicomonas sp. SCSIO W0465]